MHNQRNRHAAALRPPSAKMPAFPADVAVPPHRGALIRSVEPATPPPAVEPSLAVLFAVPPRPKLLVKKRKPAAVRRKAQRKAKARGKPPPRGPKLIPALTLPNHAEPLTLARPAAKGRALVKHRSGGLQARLADWLSTRMQALWDGLGGVPTARPAPRRKKASVQERELIQLRAENARLKRQMDALLAHPPRPVSTAPSPA